MIWPSEKIQKQWVCKSSCWKKKHQSQNLGKLENWQIQEAQQKKVQKPNNKAPMMWYLHIRQSFTCCRTSCAVKKYFLLLDFFFFFSIFDQFKCFWITLQIWNSSCCNPNIFKNKWETKWLRLISVERVSQPFLRLWDYSDPHHNHYLQMKRTGTSGEPSQEHSTNSTRGL